MNCGRWTLTLMIAAALAVGAGAPSARAGGAPSLAVTPAQGPVGTHVQLTGTGYTPRASVKFVWQTANGSYRTQVSPSGVNFFGYAYDPSQTTLGSTVADSQGRVAASFAIPEDIGGAHLIAAVVGRQPLAQSAFQVVFDATMTPLSGTVGTPIEITVHGQGPDPWSTTAVRYDNHFTGFVSAVTTHGTAHARFLAAGGPGPHVIQLSSASNATPYLNAQEGPGFLLRHLSLDRSWTFTVTGNTAVPPNRLDWPAESRVARLAQDAPRAMIPPGGQPAPGVSLLPTPASGPVLSHVDLTAKGLQPRSQVQVVWVTMGQGNRMTGMSPVTTSPLFATAAKPDGTLSGQFTVPEDLGGWHLIELVQNGKAVSSAPYFVTRSLVTVVPTRVKAGQQFKVEIKGIGWTEIDNGVAVNYDNAYEGYACGFNSRGDVTLYLTATGAPGVHLIDLYPMLYQGHGQPPWTYQVPQLTALEDGPGLGLGYGLPIVHVAVTVVP